MVPAYLATGLGTRRSPRTDTSIGKSSWSCCPPSSAGESSRNSMLGWMSLLCWSSFAAALLFAVVASVGLLAWESLGVATARNMMLGSIVLLVTSMLLAMAILIFESLAAGDTTADTSKPAGAAPPAASLFPDFPAADEPAESTGDAALPAAADTDTDDDF